LARNREMVFQRERLRKKRTGRRKPQKKRAGCRMGREGERGDPKLPGKQSRLGDRGKGSLRKGEVQVKRKRLPRKATENARIVGVGGEAFGEKEKNLEEW